MSVLTATPPRETELIPLTLLRPGQAARVDQVLGSGDLVHRLREMGLPTSGTNSSVSAFSPSSSGRLTPFSIARRAAAGAGYWLGIRSAELAGILVRPAG